MVQTFKDYLLEQVCLHPTMQPQDVVKMCYQAAFGAEHLLADKEAAFTWLSQEFEEIEVTDVSEKLYEQIHDKVCRMNLREWKRRNMPLIWLFRMFVESASFIDIHAEDNFAQCLKEAEELVKEGEFSFSFIEWERTSKQDPVHHSEEYRQQEHPAYRIVCSRYIRLLPILEKIAKLPQKKIHTIAIDGRCASGKTTMAGMLAKVLDAGVVHMDDFFLPLELRTKERFATPGGNIHYERVRDEVLPKLKAVEDFTYQRFDCSRMMLGDFVTVKGGNYYIVEGAYSCHPALGDYMACKVFCDVEAAEQLERIRRRDGEEMLERFKKSWIPMEEAYFSSLGESGRMNDTECILLCTE